MGDVEGAIRQWRTAAEIDSKAALPQLLVAAAHYAKDDRPGGLAMADAALELDRDYANLAVLKKNLWSDRLLTDTQKLLTYFTPIKILTGHSESKITEKDIKSIVISPDGQILASGGQDDTIKIWNLRTGQLLHTLAHPSNWGVSLAMSTDGQTLVSLGDDTSANYIKVWDLRTGQLLRTFTEHLSLYTVLAISSDGQTLVTGGGHDPIRLWNLNTGQLRNTLTERSDALVLSTDGQTLVSQHSDNIIKVWNLQTGEVKSNFKTDSGDRFSGLAISPDGQTLANGGADGTIKLWDLRIGKLKSTLKHSNRIDSTVDSIAFSPDGQTLATIYFDMIQLWNLRTNQLLRTLKYRDVKGIDQQFKDVVFSADSQTIVSATDDGKIQIWQLAER